MAWNDKMSDKETDEENELFRSIEYPDFDLVVWKLHPAVKKGIDIQAVANALPDFKQGVVGAAEFMLLSETKSLLYDVIIMSELHDIKLKVIFPFIKGRGPEKKPFNKKRIVQVGIIDSRMSVEEKWANQPFAKVLGWDLGDRFECSGGW
jgi:hypothetical protein